MPTFSVNTDALIKHTHRLDGLKRSALPVAIRQTLNAAAFDVKQKTLPASAKKNFITRAPTFFKAFSGVNKATGFNINAMKAEVGMSANGKLSAETAVANMAVQESGGVIRKGADYLKAARSGSNARKVKAINYFSKDKLVKGKFKRPGTAKSNFVAAAAVAMREGKNVSIKTARGRYLMKVTSISQNRKSKRINIKSQLLLKNRADKPARISATHFSQEAATATTAKMENFYKAEAEKQFARALKK